MPFGAPQGPGYQEGYVQKELKANAVVVLRGATWEDGDSGEVSQAVVDLRNALRDDVLIVTLAPEDSLDVLDEEQMLQAGWVRTVTTNLGNIIDVETHDKEVIDLGSD